jgi:hypothetical protein
MQHIALRVESSRSPMTSGVGHRSSYRAGPADAQRAASSKARPQPLELDRGLADTLLAMRASTTAHGWLQVHRADESAPHGVQDDVIAREPGDDDRLRVATPPDAAAFSGMVESGEANRAVSRLGLGAEHDWNRLDRGSDPVQVGRYGLRHVDHITTRVIRGTRPGAPFVEPRIVPTDGLEPRRPPP